MPELLTEFEMVFRNRNRLEMLMNLAKTRRRLAEQDLLFVGPSTIARYYWCAMQSVYAAREAELGSFTQFLAARIFNAYNLGLITRFPASDSEILSIGEEITLDDVLVLASTNQSYSMKAGSQSSIRFDKDYLLELAKSERSPLAKGVILEDALAEKYHTVSWNFDWGEYVVAGEPDGITERFVYEFKSTSVLWYMKPVAFAQADLYAYFFKKDIKRVQIYSVDTGKTSTWEERADFLASEQTLCKFRNMVNGELPQPPKAWKCKTCKFAQVCPIKPSHQMSLFDS